MLALLLGIGPVLSAGVNAKVAKAFPDIVRRYVYLFLAFEIGVHPAVSVCRMALVALFNQLQDLGPLHGNYAVALPPLVIARPGYAAERAELFYRELPRQPLDDAVFLSDTGTNSPGIPSSFGIRV